MFLRLLLLFTAIPVIELLVLIEIGKMLGTVPTVFLVIGTGALGAWLTKLQGFFVLRRLQNDAAAGQLPGDAIVDGVLVLVGGITLLTPGFITDVLGFSLLFPVTRLWWRKLLVDRLRAYVERGQVHVYRDNGW